MDRREVQREEQVQHITLRDKASDYQLCPKTQGRATRTICAKCANMKMRQVGADQQGAFEVFFCNYKDEQEGRKNAGD